MMGEIRDFLWGLLGIVVLLVIVAMLFEVVVITGLAPEPGDPFYVAWLDVTRYGWQALVWLVPGAGAAAYLVLKLLPDSGGF